MGLKRKVELTFMTKNHGVRTKSRLGICRKKVGFGYRDTMKNHWVQTKSSFDFHVEKLWGWTKSKLVAYANFVNRFIEI